MAVPDHASIAKFYRQTLGMTDQRDGLGYGAQQAHMNFLPQSTPADKADGFYQKIGITVASFAAADYLRQSGGRYRRRGNLQISATWPTAQTRQAPL